jgi:hypothetical protein
LRILAVSDLRVQSLRLLEQVAGQVNPDLIVYGGDDVVRFGPGPHSWSPVPLISRPISRQILAPIARVVRPRIT